MPRVSRRVSTLASLFLWLSALEGCAGTSSRIDASTMGWVEVETEHILIRTDVDRDDAVDLARDYQRLVSALAENEFPCAFERTNAPREFILLEDQNEITALSRRYQAAFFTPSPSSLLDAEPQFVMGSRARTDQTQLFLHEMTHAAMAMCFPDAPPWLDEGMASFYETAYIDGGDLVLGMPAYAFVDPSTEDPKKPMPDIYRVHANRTEVWVLQRRLLPDFDDLRGLDANEFYFLDKRKRSVEDLRLRTQYYAGSWHAVHMLQFGDRKLSDRFSVYLTRLARGEADSVAWSSAFDQMSLQRWYEAYLKGDYGMARRAISTESTIDPVVRTMSQVEVALMKARIWGWDGDARADEARRYLEFARDKDPANPDVMLHWAAFEERRGRLAEGRSWLDRALSTAPNDPQVLATAVLWYAHEPELGDHDVARLRAWCQALEGSAQTAFQFAELGECALVFENPGEAITQLNRSLMLDATAWRTYALAGLALDQAERPEEAIRAYRTAIGLTGAGHQPSSLRDELEIAIDELQMRNP